MDTKEKIRAIIADYTRYKSDDIIELWNDYCDANNYDDRIYDMCVFDDMACGLAPSEVLRDFSDVDINDWYFTYGIYGAKSFNCADDENSPVYIDDLIDWIIRTEHVDFSEVFEDDDDDEN